MIALHRICYFKNARDGVYNDFIVVFCLEGSLAGFVSACTEIMIALHRICFIHFIVVCLPRGWIFVSL